MHYGTSSLVLRFALGTLLAAGCSSSNGAENVDASTPTDVTVTPDHPTPIDAAQPDTATPDTGVPEAGTPDVTPDRPPVDAGTPDASTPDAGPQPTDVPPTPTTGRLAYVAEGAEHHPAVWVQNADGSMRRQLHFSAITDSIPGQDDRVPVVSDTGVVAIHYLAWSPSGAQVAAVVTTAIDQSEVVVLNVDGGGFVASANGQYVMPALDWSADGRSLAFVMSTTAHAGALELVAADTVAHTWRFLTHNANLRGMSVRVRFNADATSVLYSSIDAEEPTNPWNYRSSVHSIRLDTLTAAPPVSSLVGRVDGITRDGASVILHRTTRATPGGASEYGLFLHPLTGATETVLVDRVSVTSAAQGPRDGAMLIFDASPDGTSGVYRVALPDHTDARVDLPGAAQSVAIWWPAP